MTKLELFKMLEKVPDDSEILFYNGLVQDYQPIDNEGVIERDTYRHSKIYWENGRKMDWYHKNDTSFNKKIPDDKLLIIKKQAEEDYQENYNEFEEANSFLEEKNYDKWYDPEVKKLFAIQAGAANKTCHDRLGSIDY